MSSNVHLECSLVGSKALGLPAAPAEESLISRQCGNIRGLGHMHGYCRGESRHC